MIDWLMFCDTDLEWGECSGAQSPSNLYFLLGGGPMFEAVTQNNQISPLRRNLATIYNIFDPLVTCNGDWQILAPAHLHYA